MWIAASVDFIEAQPRTDGNGSLPTLPSSLSQAFLHSHFQVSPEQILKKKKEKKHLFNGCNNSPQKRDSSSQSIIPNNM